MRILDYTIFDGFIIHWKKKIPCNFKPGNLHSYHFYAWAVYKSYIFKIKIFYLHFPVRNFDFFVLTYFLLLGFNSVMDTHIVGWFHDEINGSQLSE